MEEIVKPYTNQLQEYIQNIIKVSSIGNILEYRTCLTLNEKEYVTTITLHKTVNGITGFLDFSINKTKKESIQEASKNALEKLKENEKICPQCKQRILLN